MSEEADETPEVEETEFDPARARAALEKARREAHGLRTRLKELEPLATKAREADEAAKTQAQKDAEAKAAIERERDEARAEVLRMRVATAKGLPPELAARLRGSTEDELTKDADELLKLVTPQQSTARPVPELRSGALPADNAGRAFDADAWIRKSAGVTPR